MSFIGLVTRKDKKNGVYLQAKVIAPNKKLSSTANFKVTVEPNEVDDYMLCVIDNARARAKINAGIGDVSNVNGDIAEFFTKVGINKTNTEYTFYNVATSGGKFSDYMTSDGKFIKKPKYGESEVTGSLELRTTKKNANGITTAEVVTHIILAIQPLTVQDVLNSPEFNKNTIWNKIKGGNKEASLKGWESIYSDLNFINKLSSENLKDDMSIGVTCTVIDPEDRINSDGTIAEQLTFKEASEKYQELLNSGLGYTCEFKSDYNNKEINYVFSGITLKVSLSLATETVDYIYDCKIRSAYLTNQEVAMALVQSNKLAIVNSQNNNKYYYKQNGTSVSEQNIIVYSSLWDSLTLKAPRNAYDVSLPEYNLTGIGNNPKVIITITNLCKNQDGTGSYPYYGDVIKTDNTDLDNMLFIIEKDALRSRINTDEAKNFCIEASIDISNYAGSTANAKVYSRFKIDTTDLATSSGGGSGSPTDTPITS